MAVLVAFTALPQAADAAQFGLARLRQTSATGAEDYLYTDGGVVFAQGTVDAAYYRFSVVDPTGTVKASTACAQSLSKRSANFKYTIQPTDPTTGATAWRFRLDEWSNFACSGSPTKTGSKYFDIARASSFADSTLTTPRAVFAAGSSAYVKASGIGAVRLSAANTAVSDWQTTWLKPSGATACANTANVDRPDASAAGLLAAGSYLKYRPNAAAPSDPWNLESNFETRPCQDFTAATEGTWKVRLQKDGTHFVTLKAFDVDATPPDTTITTRPAGGTPFTDPDLAFVASQPDATFQCQLDGGGWAACTSPKHYTGLSESTHTFQVRAVDPAGNVDPTPASATWTVDTTLPAVTLTTPANGSATSDTTPDLGGAAGNAPGDAADVTVKILRPVAGAPDELVQTLTTARTGATWSVAPTVPLPDGTYRVHAEQADALAGVAFTAEHTFRVDTTAPDVAVLEPRIDTVTSDTTPQLWGTGGLATGDAPEVTVKLWAGASATGTPAQTATATVDSAGNWTLDASPALADGTYTVRVEQLDDAGNLGVSRAHTFDVDSTAPDTNITAGPNGATASSAASFRFTSTEAGSSFECLIDDGDWADCSSPKAYSSLAAGSHTFMVRAVDAAGNEDPTPATATWTVDMTLPAITLVNPADGTATNNNAPVFDGSAGTAAGDSPTVTVKVYRPVASAPDELVESNTTTRAADGSWSTPANPSLPEGDYIVRAEQADGASNVGMSAAHSFRVDRTTPDTLFTQTPPAMTGTTSADFRFDSTEAGASFECRLDGGAWAACASPHAEPGLERRLAHLPGARDRPAGNTDATPATVTWIVNPALPATHARARRWTAPARATPRRASAAWRGIASGDSEHGHAEDLPPRRRRAGHAGADADDRPLVARRHVDGGRVARPRGWSLLGVRGAGRDGGYRRERGHLVHGRHHAAAHLDLEQPAGLDRRDLGQLRVLGERGRVDVRVPARRRLLGAVLLAAVVQRACPTTCTPSTCAPPTTWATWTRRPRPAPGRWTRPGRTSTLEVPADDALTGDSTPIFSGHASTAAGDSDNRERRGVPARGRCGGRARRRPVSAARSAVDGSWSVSASPALADGTYVAYATQDDSNSETAYSAPRTFTVDTTEPGVTLTAPRRGAPDERHHADAQRRRRHGPGRRGDRDRRSCTRAPACPAPRSRRSPPRAAAARGRSSRARSPTAPTRRARGRPTRRATLARACRGASRSTRRRPTRAIDSGPSGNTTATTAAFGFSSPEAGRDFECSLDGGAWSAVHLPAGLHRPRGRRT